MESHTNSAKHRNKYQPIREDDQGNHGIWAAGLFAIIVGSSVFNMDESYDHVTYTKNQAEFVKQINYSQYTCPPPVEKIKDITPELESLVKNAHTFRKTVLSGNESIRYDFNYFDKDGKVNSKYSCSIYSIKK